MANTTYINKFKKDGKINCYLLFRTAMMDGELMCVSEFFFPKDNEFISKDEMTFDYNNELLLNDNDTYKIINDFDLNKVANFVLKNNSSNIYQIIAEEDKGLILYIELDISDEDFFKANEKYITVYNELKKIKKDDARKQKVMAKMPSLLKNLKYIDDEGNERFSFLVMTDYTPIRLTVLDMYKIGYKE